MLPKDHAESSGLLALSLSLVLAFSVLCLLAVSLLKYGDNPITGKFAGLEAWLWWLPVGVVLLAANQTLVVWHSRSRHYLLLAVNRVVQTVMTGVVSITLGVSKIGGGLVVAALVGQLIALSLLVKKSLGEWRLSWPAFLKIATVHQDAPKYLLPTALLDVLTQQVPLYMIGVLFTLNDAGQFGMAYRVLALPSALIGGAVGQVFYQRFATAWPNRQEARRVLFMTWKRLALMGLIPTVLVLFWGNELFSFFLGPKWQVAGDMASAMALMLYVMFISSPTSSAYLVLGLQKYTLLFGISFIFYRSFSFYFGIYFNSVLIGLYMWMVLEIFVIIFYNAVLLKKLRG